VAPVTTPRLELFNRILEQGVRPLLKEAGFAKSGLEFKRRRGDLIDCVRFQRGRWDGPRRLSFTVNCGVYVVGAREVWTDACIGERPGEVKAAVRARIGSVCGDEADVWWELSVRWRRRKVAAAADDLVERLRDKVLPWFGRFRTPINVGDYLVDPEPGPGRVRIGYREVVQSAEDLCEAAACYVVGGRIDLAHKWLDVAIEGGKPKWRREMARELKARIERLVAMGRFPRRPSEAPGPPGDPD
jgi:hypothetical protein